MGPLFFMKLTIRPFLASDLTRYYLWAKNEHVKNSWFIEGYQKVEEIESLLKGNHYDFPFIFECDGLPIGYLVYCDLYAYKIHCKKPSGVFQNEDPHTACIDLFIGEVEFLGKGIGTKVVKKFCQLIFKRGFERILIDPSAENKSAISCYQKAGFKKVKELFDGVAQVLILELRKEAK